MYDLECRFDSRQSFYGKAKVEITLTTYEQTIDLYSYGTLVASVITNFNDMKRKYIYNGQYSQTTTRHQKEFFKQQGLSNKEIKELFKNGILEKEV